MFTGIVEEIGIVKNITKLSNGASIEVECKEILIDTKIGDSISINGVCQTVTKLSQSSFSANISDETLSVTTFKGIKKGDFVNLERALTLSAHLGGHIVSGHVDCIGEFYNIEKLTDFYNLTFKIPIIYTKYIVYKGSITINGISLTISEINDNKFKVAIIPHTYENTNLKFLKIGDPINIETDILGKYIEKILYSRDNKRDISIEFLQENGFI